MTGQRPFTFGISLRGGIPTQCDRHVERTLSDMGGYYDDDQSYDYYQLLPRCIGDYAPIYSHADWPTGTSTALWLAPAQANPGGFPVRIAFHLPCAMPIRLEVFDVTGRRWDLLAQGEHEHGLYGVVWDGKHRAGGRAPSGIYLARLTAPGRVVTSRMCLLRP